MKNKYALEIKLSTGEFIERLETDSPRIIWDEAWREARCARGKISVKITMEDSERILWCMTTSRWTNDVEFITLREHHTFAWWAGRIFL